MHMSESSSRNSSLFEKFIPALLIITVGLAFLVGVLWQKVNNLEKGGNANVAGDNVADDQGLPGGKLTEDQAKKVAKATNEDHIKGSLDKAELVLIEYSDFECPFCSRFHPTVKQALDEYKDKVALVYRHFPLTSIHPRALPAAIASECIAEQKGDAAFWQFADTVFANQETTLTDEGLKTAAGKLGLDVNKFTSCVTSNKYNDKVNSQTDGGTQAGVTGTPATFVVNKKGEVWLIPGALDYSSLKATLEEALNS